MKLFSGAKTYRFWSRRALVFMTGRGKKKNCYFAMNYINEFGKVENMGGDTNRLDIIFVKELCLKERT